MPPIDPKKIRIMMVRAKHRKKSPADLKKIRSLAFAIGNELS